MVMRHFFLSIAALMLAVLPSSAQLQYPDVDFEESPGTHNVHLCSDGQFLYTVNGGRPEMGMIFKRNLEGELLESYKIELDMRGVFTYGGKLYVSSYGGDLYVITKLKKGKVKLVQKSVAASDQSNITLVPGTSLTISINENEVKFFHLETNEVKVEYQDLSLGSEITSGLVTIAATDQYYLTMDGEEQMIFVYDHGFRLKGKFKIPYGDYGFSLSYANGKVWVAEDGNYSMGHWYGYDLERAVEVAQTEIVVEELSPVVTFSENPGNHNMGICSDGNDYFTFNGGAEESGTIRQYNSRFEKIGEYKINLDMRSGFFDNGWLYVTTYGGKLYKILSLNEGRYEEMFSGLWSDEQSSASSYSPGRFGVLSYGVLYLFELDDGDIVSSNPGLLSGEEPATGNSSVAFGDDRIYTYVGEESTLYVYNLKGEMLAFYHLTLGSYGFSLSFAKGMVWLAEDGNYYTGQWYGYRIP